jgi:hypothetical protein
MVVQCTPSVEYCHAYVKIGVGLALHVPVPAEMRVPRESRRCP